MDTRGSFQHSARSTHVRPAYNGIKNVLESVYKEGGVRGLYRGIGILYGSLLLKTLDGYYLTSYGIYLVFIVIYCSIHLNLHFPL